MMVHFVTQRTSNKVLASQLFGLLCINSKADAEDVESVSNEIIVLVKISNLRISKKTSNSGLGGLHQKIRSILVKISYSIRDSRIVKIITASVCGMFLSRTGRENHHC